MKDFKPAMSLQLFADAGTVVNATGSYTNAYTGDTTAFSGSNTLSAELKTFYDTELLENARLEMFYAQFAKVQPLPANHGKNVEWRKWNTFEKASKLVEGVIPTGQKFGMSTKTGAIDQYGTYAAISDTLELRAYDDVILGATEEMGASAAETQETLIRDTLLTNTNSFYCPNINTSTGAVVSTPSALKELKAVEADDTDGMAALTPLVISKVVTKLKKDRVPTIGGRYYAVIHPSVAGDLRNSKDWLEAHKYAAPDEIFNGEIGELHNVRFIENVFAPVICGADLASDSRTLTVNGAVSAATSVTFDGGSVAADALIGRYVLIGGTKAKITDNTATTLTLDTAVTAADNASIYPGEGAAAGKAAYVTTFLGKDAFGIIDPEGGALETIIHDKSEIGGPLNQFSTVGYKLETNGATVLYPERVCNVFSCSSFSGTDEAN
nr:MAG TPA: major capsid protein [Caudoviricetes sp.]